MANTVTILINARNRAEDGFASVRAAVQRMATTLRTHMASSFNHVRSAFSNLGDHMRNTMSRMTPWFSRIGRSMRTELMRGLGAIGRGARRAGGLLVSGLRASIMGPLRSLTQTMGSIFGEGIGGSLRAAGSNPYIAAGVVALVGSILPVLGTAIGGALVLGIGGGLAGLGLMFAAKSKEAQKSFEKTGHVIKKVMGEAAKPLIPVITHAMDLTQKFVKQAGPGLKSIFKDMAPHLEKFTDSLFKAFKALKPAVKPITDAFGLLLDALGPALVDVFKSIGISLKNLGKEFQNKDTIANFVDIFKVLLSIIPIAIDTFTILAKVMRFYREAVRASIPVIKDIINWIKRIVGKTVHFAQKGASTVVQWAKNVANFVKNIKNKVVSIAQKGASTVVQWAKNVRNFVNNIKNRTVSIAQRGAQTVVSWVSRVINTIRRFVGKTVGIGVRGVSGAISAVQGLINRIRNLTGKVVSIGVNFFKNAGGKLASALGFAHGGIVGAAAGGARSALTLVGEHGPELVDLAPGSRVHSNEDSRRMVSMGGGGVTKVVLEIRSGGSKVDNLLVEVLRKAVFARGGNVQTVLGRG